MNKFQIYKTLRSHVKLAEQRSVLYDTNRVAKVLIFIAVSMVALYLMFISVMLSFISFSVKELTACQMFYGILPFLLILDFFVRILSQRTPAQMVKPYLLLPLSRYDCVDCFILSSIVSPNNLIWFFLTVPYAIMTIVFSAGFLSALSFVVSVQLIFVCNSLVYMFCRTLFSDKIYWFLLPIAFYAAMLSPVFFDGFAAHFRFYSTFGSWASDLNPALYVVVAAWLIFMFWANRLLQNKYIGRETRMEKDIKLNHISSFSFLDKFNQVGEYLKIEMKCMLRNKNTRQTFVFSTIFIVVISLLDSFTDIYDDGFSTKFWSLYPFTLMSINLVRIMSPEGNYIECLLVHKQNIRSLLEAKYYFYSFMLLLPLVLMLPTVFSGKYSFLLLLSMMTFTAGPMFCMLMQLAVKNKVTIPLNTKMTRRNGMETNYIQIIVEMVALFMPVVLLSVLQAVMSDTLSYVFILFVGILFVCTHKLWINNIYKRMMKHKYENLEGFMTSR